MINPLRKLPGPAKGRLKTVYFRTLGKLHRFRFLSEKEPSNGWPVLLGMSYPKSGTHLLEQILLGFSKVSPFSPHIPVLLRWFEFDSDKILQVDQNAMVKDRVDFILDFLNKLKPLDVAKGHLPAWPEVRERVSSSDFIPYFIYRDLRDIAVSLVFFLTDIAHGHRYHPLFSKNLKTFDERLTVSIQGIDSRDFRLSNIAKSFETYYAWLDCPQVHKVRFEDLIHDRYNTLGGIVDHFLSKVDTLSSTREEIIAALTHNIDPGKSHTFRSGKTGEWKKYFTEEHKKIFKDVAGDLLIRLGYEKDNDW